MKPSMPKPARSQEGPNWDAVRPVMAKAAGPVTDGHIPLRAVIADVVRSVGKMEATADDMQIDRAQLYRQLANGHLTIERLEPLGVEFFAALGTELVAQFGPLATPKARAQFKLREMLAALEEIADGLP